ncbi:hypothetical protein BG015_011651 [Linnemannia schmuckeri]|uniref:Arm-like repeat domain-containing protein n=1 Tax=Linnemannia schmuckeri TaxID=64567 RepID=A0A9P5RV34_9FUNG|nr:hypothetical protein BG015_011651 [Linnemannia schmuckeri]
MQSASSGFLVSDDSIKVLSLLRTHLEETHQQLPEHFYHLALAASRMLDVMADHKVQDLDRVLEHESLSALFSGLKDSSDPYLIYQACYAYQALQYVPDDETALQTVWRHSSGVVDGLVKVSSVIKLGLGSVLEGLEKLEEVAISAFGIVGTIYEGGICQLLGEIAADSAWTVATRQQAIDLLGHLYRNDEDWGRDESVSTCMLTIIDKLGSISD